MTAAVTRGRLAPRDAHHYAFLIGECSGYRVNLCNVGDGTMVLEIRTIGRPVKPAVTLRSVEECDEWLRANR